MGKNVVKLNVVLADVIQGVYERKGERSEMTEQEAIKEIKRWSRILMSAGKECTEVTAEAQDMAVQALEDIQKYRTIGTVEECRTAREKQDEGGNDDDKDSDESDNQVRTYRHPLADTGTYIL
jgi:hypothetical protein